MSGVGNFSLTIAPRNIKPPTICRRTFMPKTPDMVSKELVEPLDTEEAPDIGEVENAKQ